LRDALIAVRLENHWFGTIFGCFAAECVNVSEEADLIFCMVIVLMIA
jgi:hypothetical protein